MSASPDAADATTIRQELFRDRARLFPGEELRHAVLPQLAYWQDGQANRPTVIFLPGSVHLARVAYGHPGSNPRDFLAYWLRETGFPFLALSYPSDHPAFPTRHAEMTITEWGESAAALANDILQEKERRRQVILAGRSMAGRVCTAFATAAHRLGLELELFISLAATAPIPGLGPIGLGSEPLTASGFWDGLGASESGAARRERFLAGLAEQNRLTGRAILTPEEWRLFYLCNNPMQLLGSEYRLKCGSPQPDMAETIADLKSFQFADHPLTGIIVPESQIDARHVLTDTATWSFMNAQWFYHRLAGANAKRRVPQSQWQDLIKLSSELPRRMSRQVPGSHFFFLGEPGAKTTAEHIAALCIEANEVRKALKAS